MVTATSYPEVNAILEELLTGAKAVLGSQFIGMYLHGSLANGDFDRDSDVDAVIVTEGEISDRLFSALEIMHTNKAALDSWCATQLEVSYIPKQSLRRFDAADTLHPHIDRGRGEHLHKMQHGQDWLVQRHILREKGIAIAGPPAHTLIDPVSPDDLKRAVLAILQVWATSVLDDPDQIQHRGYQSFYVLSMCRILYTLEYGIVVSKPVAARWVQETLEERWILVIERAWTGRQNPGSMATPQDVNETLDFIRYTIEYSRRMEQGKFS